MSERDVDLRPPSITYTLTVGLPWWRRVTVDGGNDLDPAARLTVALLEDWTFRVPVPGPGVEVRRDESGATWIGQDAAYAPGVFYVMLSPDGQAPAVPRLAVSLVLKPAGGR